MAFSKAEEFEEKDILAARFAKALSHQIGRASCRERV